MHAVVLLPAIAANSAWASAAEGYTETLSSTASTLSALLKSGLWTFVGAILATCAGMPTHEASCGDHGVTRVGAAAAPPDDHPEGRSDSWRSAAVPARRRLRVDRGRPGGRRRSTPTSPVVAGPGWRAGVGSSGVEGAIAGGQAAEEPSGQRRCEDTHERPPDGTPPVLHALLGHVRPLLLHERHRRSPPAGRRRAALSRQENVVGAGTTRPNSTSEPAFDQEERRPGAD